MLSMDNWPCRMATKCLQQLHLLLTLAHEPTQMNRKGSTANLIHHFRGGPVGALKPSLYLLAQLDTLKILQEISRSIVTVARKQVRSTGLGEL